MGGRKGLRVAVAARLGADGRKDGREEESEWGAAHGQARADDGDVVFDDGPDRRGKIVC